MAIAEAGGAPPAGPIDVGVATAPDEDPQQWIAVLAADGTLVSFDKSGKADGIAVPVGCDLDPGKYRWNAPAARFDHIPEAFGERPALPPDQVKAIARGFMAIRDARLVRLPAATLAWLDWYATSMDNQD